MRYTCYVWYICVREGAKIEPKRFAIHVPNFNVTLKVCLKSTVVSDNHRHKSAKKKFYSFGAYLYGPFIEQLYLFLQMNINHLWIYACADNYWMFWPTMAKMEVENIPDICIKCCPLKSWPCWKKVKIKHKFNQKKKFKIGTLKWGNDKMQLKVWS